MSAKGLIVFVKQPTAGLVKTRLAPVLGAQAAAELYRVLAEEEIRRTAPRGDEYERLFFFAPPEARAELERWLGEGTWIPQAEGNLGERMAEAFAEAFRRGAARVAIIGTDTPWVGRGHVRRALALLDRNDLVLGPAHDGGYYLLALKSARPELFEDVAWSTSSVAETTIQRAGQHGLQVARLEPLADIDTIADIRGQWKRLRPLLAGRPLAEVVERALGTAGS